MPKNNKNPLNRLLLSMSCIKTRNRPFFLQKQLLSGMIVDNESIAAGHPLHGYRYIRHNLQKINLIDSVWQSGIMSFYEERYFVGSRIPSQPPTGIFPACTLYSVQLC